MELGGLEDQAREFPDALGRRLRVILHHPAAQDHVVTQDVPSEAYPRDCFMERARALVFGIRRPCSICAPGGPTHLRQLPDGGDEQGVPLGYLRIQKDLRRQGEGRARARPLPPLRIPYFLVAGRHPQPQLLLADGRGAWFFLVIRLPISLTSFWSGFSPQGPLDQGVRRENGCLPRRRIEARARTAGGRLCWALAQRRILSPQRSFECPELLDPGLDIRKLRRDQLLQAGPQVLAAPRIRVDGDLPDTRQREADLLCPPDELETLKVFR